MSFGKPIGKARIAAVPRAVPPPPPSEMTPSIFLSATSWASRTGAALDMATTHSPRSCWSISGCRSRPAALATWKRVMSGVTCGSVPVPKSMSTGVCPRLWIRSATKACSWPLESRVPITAMVAMGSLELEFTFDRDSLELLGECCQWLFDGHTFEAGCSDKANSIGMLVHIGGVFGLENRSAVAEHHDVFID